MISISAAVLGNSTMKRRYNDIYGYFSLLPVRTLSEALQSWQDKRQDRLLRNARGSHCQQVHDPHWRRTGPRRQRRMRRCIFRRVLIKMHLLPKSQDHFTHRKRQILRWGKSRKTLPWTSLRRRGSDRSSYSHALRSDGCESNKTSKRNRLNTLKICMRKKKVKE